MQAYVFLSFILSVGILACGGGSTSNVEACKDLVAKINSFECVDDQPALNAAATCPAQFDEIEGDYTAYYQCIEDAYECPDDIEEDSDEVDLEDDTMAEDMLACAEKMPTVTGTRTY
ncbi:MAG: hypothetical protein QGI45_06255 [Myxococcota bacterium]|nr:hypothetical protein [Myxococcota bacterium]